MRRASRIDDNHGAIKRAFQSFGCWVGDLHSLGGGWPDLLVSIPPSHVSVLIEVKDGQKSPSRQKLTEAEADFHNEFPGPLHIVRDAKGVETVVRYYRDLGE